MFVLEVSTTVWVLSHIPVVIASRAEPPFLRIPQAASFASVKGHVLITVCPLTKPAVKGFFQLINFSTHSNLILIFLNRS